MIHKVKVKGGINERRSEFKTGGGSVAVGRPDCCVWCPGILQQYTLFMATAE